MLKIIEMNAAETRRLLTESDFGHLGCSLDDQPYVLPFHYAFDGENILLLTTEGQKTVCLAQNPKVCFQIEKIVGENEWQSVVVTGRAERLTDAERIGRAGTFLFQKHPSLTPAIHDSVAGRTEIYQIRPVVVTGRRTA